MEWVDLLQKVGFPILVAGWFMLRLEKRLDRQAELSANLMQAISVLAKALDGMGMTNSNGGEQPRRRMRTPGRGLPLPAPPPEKKELP